MTVFSFEHKARYLHYVILLTTIWGLLASNPYSKYLQSHAHIFWGRD